MNSISLKYRIAITFFVLEAVMVALVLWRAQSVSYDEVSSKLQEHEQIYLGLLSDLGRDALVTSEYGELQHYVDKLGKLVSIGCICITDARNVIVVSSRHELLSRVLPELKDDENEHWVSRPIHIASGDIGKVYIRFSNARIREAYQKSIVQGIATAGLSMAVIAVAGLIIGFLLVSRLARLNALAQKMAEGNLDIRAEISGADEIAQLGSTFNLMAQKVRSSIDSLERSERGLKEAQRLARVGSWRWTVAGDNVVWSEELYNISGLDSRRTAPSYAELPAYYTPESWKLLNEAVEKALQTGEPYELDLEMVLPDGTVRNTFSRGEADLDASGNVVGLHGTVLDITERKRAEERIRRSLREKEVLLSEVHHRVKNNMAVISSLLALQSRHLNDVRDRDMFKESQGRIRSMALIHERLYQNNDFAHIDLPDYFSALVNNIKNTFTISSELRVNLEVEHVNLDIDTLVPCGLIINELLTNAFKYAFEGHASPEIGIAIRKLDSSSFALTVSDNGAGLPPGFDVTHSTGLGLQLVNTLCRQIKGTLETSNSGGAVFSLTFPNKIEFARYNGNG